MHIQEQTITNPQHYFYLSNNQALKTVPELLTITTKDYEQHVNQEKNDFANWVQHVFKETELAQEIREAKSYDEFKKVIHEATENDYENEELIQEQKKQPRQQAVHEEEIIPSRQQAVHEEETIPSQQQYSQEDEQKYTGDAGTQYRDELSDKFYEAHRRLEEKTTFETPEQTTKNLDVIQEKERALRQEISEQRKKGYDLFIADMILQKLRPLTDMAKATNEPEDFDNIEALFKEVREEIEYAKNNPLPDIKKEIDDLVAQHKEEGATQ